ncbi:MAG: hypothetical protein NTV03_00315 [Candidatus Nomurabacteria bacterium]|nr:hypothetical protein [Candidatus Nomurabacteria bacterium]
MKIFNEMNKKLLIIVVVVLVLIGSGYYYWKIKPQQKAEDIQKTKANISADVGNNVTPDMTTPDANPYSKTNPFTNLKTNPFQ